MLHLVRHALAGSRSAWGGVDFDRPLDATGRAQAIAIGAELSQRPVRRVLSSPAVRCTQTVEPLAELLSLEIETADALAEGAPTPETFELLWTVAAADGDSVLCSHGDVIPAVIWWLASYRLEIPDRFRCKKSCIWELHVAKRPTGEPDIVGTRYRHPREFGAHLT